MRGVWLALLLLGAANAWAEKADRDKPMNISADALRYDDITQTSVFTGNVVITKGTILIRGGRVEVKQDAQGYQIGTATAAPGTLAYFKQKREAVDETIEGQAQVIEYDSRADTIKLTRQATMRRYRGATLSDETNGERIDYDNVRDVFTAHSGGNAKTNNGPTTTTSNTGRVRAMLTPNRLASQPASSANPAAPVQLRASPLINDPQP